MKEDGTDETEEARLLHSAERKLNWRVGGMSGARTARGRCPTACHGFQGRRCSPAAPPVPRRPCSLTCSVPSLACAQILPGLAMLSIVSIGLAMMML